MLEANILQSDKLKKAQQTIRLINLIFAFSLVGLVVTALIMNLQFILGNGLGFELIPKLGSVEIMILLLLNFFIFLAAIIIVGVFVGISNDDITNNESQTNGDPALDPQLRNFMSK